MERSLQKGSDLLRHGERVKFAFIEAEKASFLVAFMCRHLGISTSGLYAWRARPESKQTKEDRRLAVLVRESHELSRQYYGSARIHEDLKQAKQIRISRKRVIRLMQEVALKGKVRRSWVKTTDSRHNLPVAPNLLIGTSRRAHPTSADWRTSPRSEARRGALSGGDPRSSFEDGGWVGGERGYRSASGDQGVERGAQTSRARSWASPHSGQASNYASEDYQNVLEANGIPPGIQSSQRFPSASA